MTNSITKKYIVKKIVYATSVKDAYTKEKGAEIIEVIYDNVWEREGNLGFKK